MTFLVKAPHHILEETPESADAPLPEPAEA